MEQKKKIKIIIIVLAVLLGISLLALCGTLIYKKVANTAPAAVTVPDNLITPDGDGDSSAEDGGETPDISSDVTPSDTQPVSGASAKPQKAVNIELYNRQPEENTPFEVGNMFPGDSETKYFRVRVSYHNTVTVHCQAAARPGYEKLAEVMKFRIKLLTTGETLYDGTIADMPESLAHKLASDKSTTEELYYEITAYLDTSVGNEYQNKDLIADFRWWIEGTENLDSSPKTGDRSDTLLWGAIALASGGVLLILLAIRRRKEEENDRD